jgi:hypothetical protein
MIGGLGLAVTLLQYLAFVALVVYIISLFARLVGAVENIAEVYSKNSAQRGNEKDIHQISAEEQ